MAAGDVNNDTYPDLVIADEYDYYLQVLINNQDGSFASPVALEVENYPLAACVSDFNGDNWPDIAATIYYDYVHLAILLNNGDGSFGSPVYYEIYEDGYTIASADYDKDDDNDIAVACIYSNSIMMFENDGTGTFTHNVDYGTAFYPQGMCQADLDNDDDIDFATANYDTSTVSVLWNRFEIISDLDEQSGESVLPAKFAIGQNYPNPFNPITIIEYSVPSRAHVSIDIFNILGQRVRTLIDEVKSSGRYRTKWAGDDDFGRPVSTGIYFYRFRAGDTMPTKKKVLSK